MFCIKNKKLGIPPANSSFSIEVGFMGVYISLIMLFLMLCKIFKFFSDSNVTLITKH